MRFEISYRGGTTHEVDLPASVAVLGRDPGCDVVLNDSKCSRRHAVVEDGPEGVVVRDAESANGIFLNGRKVERAVLAPGDTLRLGDVRIRLLPEVGATVVVAPEDLDLSADPGTVKGGTPPAPFPSLSPPGSGPRPPVPAREPSSPRRARPPGRPATVSVLVVLWALLAPAAVAAALHAASRVGGGLAWAAGSLAGLGMAGLALTMAAGLHAMAPWARHLQIATAGLGLLVCPLTLTAATVLLYMTRPEVRAAFERAPRPAMANGGADSTFAVSIVGMLVLGLALSAVAALFLL